MSELQKLYKDFSNKVYVLTFGKSTMGAEDKIIELEYESSDEFIKIFMREQYFEKVSIKEVESSTRTYLLE
ncbi:hypothetical protein PQE68_gp041 [Bacillus phage vB_BanS_Sophrita]|uniref:Uncharacterized protein n=1 Tax=Bacillus phage vB_BanS_Sophrita TaxID=2894790 RepID=A0AAE8YU48_9CAUD|nr:hypothetical protein PQE68_gp041 [Bacillus phage vB_BanS_Sophrita]UGO50632.1 hypothetical protein SOPHRITA_41 [Bacillus phage vB_BanS_Sophrita]